MSDFLREMDQAGETFSGDGPNIVGRVLIEFGFHRYVNGHDFWEFWQPVRLPKEVNIVSGQVRDRLTQAFKDRMEAAETAKNHVLIEQLNQAGYNNSPSFGIKITIKADVLSREESYKTDLEAFTPKWQKARYKLLLDSIDDNDLPIGKVFLGRVQYKADPFAVEKGEAGKTDTDQNGNPRYPSVRVPVEKFANEQLARAVVAAAATTDTGTITLNQLSEKAQEQFKSISSFLGQAEEVQKWHQNALNGVAFPNKPLEDYIGTDGKLDKKVGSMYIADCWNLEYEDIEILLKEIPF